jgi:hypothetical protein
MELDKDLANLSYREIVSRAKKTVKKAKEPKKKRKIYIPAIRATIYTNKSYKKAIDFYNRIYPDYEIKIEKKYHE